MIRIAVIGYGYWGPNIVRNFSRVPGCTVRWICDVHAQALKPLTLTYPATKLTTSFSDVLQDPLVDAIVIATPNATHFPLGVKALVAGKHVLLEKPMTQTSRQARSLVTLARKKKKILMVDHTFVYTPAVAKLREILNKQALGDILSIDCVRTNLGLIQKDSNVIYDLATHDFSIINYLLGTTPRSVSARGFYLTNHESEAAAAYITANYPKNLFVHAHVSWLSPVKIRTITIIGTKKMLVYDDMESSEKIKIFDKSVSVSRDPKAIHQLRVGYRIGSMIAPHIILEEGLLGMAKAFVKAIKTGHPPISDGTTGYEVVRCIEAATVSLRRRGKSVTLS